MALREQDKHFLSSIYLAIAIILTWKGLNEGVTSIPIIGEPFNALFIGFAILTFSGLIFREFDPLGGLEKGAAKAITDMIQHPDKANFELHYQDKVLKKDVVVPGSMVKKIEENAIVIENPNKTEFFVPLHRVTEIHYKGKRYWRF